jgi:hypothetical protein
MNATKRFTANEALQGLRAKCKIAKGKGTLG